MSLFQWGMVVVGLYLLWPKIGPLVENLLGQIKWPALPSLPSVSTVNPSVSSAGNDVVDIINTFNKAKVIAKTHKSTEAAHLIDEAFAKLDILKLQD